MEKIDALLERLHKEGWMGWTHLRMWRAMAERFTAAPESARVAPAFFRITAIAHIDSAIMGLGRLLDEHRESAGVAYLLNLARSHPALFEVTPEVVTKQVGDDEQALAQLRQRAAAVKARRDRLLAHLDRKHFTNPASLVGLFDIKMAELDATFDRLQKIVNTYQILRNGEEVVWMLVGGDDVEHALDMIERGRAAVKEESARRRALFGPPE